MIVKKGFDVFVAIFLLVSAKGCSACFSEIEYTEHISKTGSHFVKDCICDRKGYSVVHLTWLDPNGQPIEPHGPDTSTYTNMYTEIQPQNGILRLIIGSISKTMSGNYTCKTNFEENTYTKTYKIEAYDSLYFVNTSKDQNAIIGEDSLIRCEVRGTVDHTVEWYRLNGSQTVALYNDTKYNLLPQGLLIKNVSIDDGGLYNCTASDMVENNVEEESINVQIAARPKILDLRFNIPLETIVAGNNVAIECVADGTPYPEYFWNKIADSQGNLIKNDNLTWTQSVNTIVFDSIQKDDAGTYVCTAANVVGSVTRTIFIQVRVPPVITHVENVTVVEGSPAQIVCKATGVPAPKILIGYNAEGMENDTRVEYKEVKNADNSELYLTIINISRSYEREYICSAANEAGNITRGMYLTVFYKPYFLEPEETVWGWNEKTVNMSCEHESNPPSTIVWKFQGNEIEHETTTAEHVQINKLLQEQNVGISGNYMALTVNNMTMYGEYQCTAGNDYGKSTKTIHLRQAFKPAAVANVTVINTSATTVTFLIQGPDATENSPVHGYTAEYDLIENYNITNVHFFRTCGLDRNFTIDRLRPNSTYSIKFAAQNEVGVGVWSDSLEFTTPETSAPEPPVLDAKAPGKLRWKAPEANGDPIDHYDVEFCPFFGQIINTTLCQKERVSTTEFPLNKLDRSTKYSFKIRAHNAHGYSDYTDEEITTPEKLIGVAVLSAGTIIGISVVVVFLCLLVLDLLLLCWRRQGIIASCFFRKNKKKTDILHARDKKGLLVKEGERKDDSLTSPNNGHRELVYNKTTGVITGKHSTV